MAKKAATATARINYPTQPKVKYVKKAGMWVKTWFEFDRNGKAMQKQEWTKDEPKV